MSGRVARGHDIPCQERRQGSGATAVQAAVAHTRNRSSCAAGERRAVRPRPIRTRQARVRHRFTGLLRLALFLLLVFIAVWAGVRVAHAGAESGVDHPKTYVVESGDTLWDIVTSHYADDVDPRRAVYEVREANALPSHAVLQPGDTLVLPFATEWSRGTLRWERDDRQPSRDTAVP